MDGTVKQILDKKGHQVTMVEPSVVLVECAKVMREDGIGSLLVVDDGKLLGILHERDICRRAVCEELNLAETPVSQIMDVEFPVVQSSTSILAAMSLISHYRVRHLPVIDDGAVAGVVSIGDLTQWVLELQEEDIQHLVAYIRGDSTPHSE